MFLILIISIISHFPVISLDNNSFKKIKNLDPYVYGKKNSKILFLTNDKILSKLKNKKISYKIEYKSEKEYEKEIKSIINNENFVKYQEIIDKINLLVTTYPTLLEKVELGVSEEGRKIIGIKNITDGKKPRYRIAAGIHGNEAMSYQIIYDFMNHLIENRDTYQDIFDNTEFWIIPMLNPDGAVNVTRRNINNIDLNRNLGFFWEKKSFAGRKPFSQKESIALRDNTISQNFTFSFSFHTYGDYINYVWNFSSDNVSDLTEILKISDIYKSFTNYTITDGFDWYRTTGDLNDYSYGTIGDIDFTIELADIDEDGTIYENNRDALISVLRTNNQGVEGEIKDINNGSIKGALSIKSKDSLFYSFDNGYFYRYLKPGEYTIIIKASGYKDVEKEFTVEENSRTKLSIIMSQEEKKLYGWKIIEGTSYLESYGEISLPKNILFQTDKKYFTFNGKGYLFVELPKRDKNYNFSIVLKDNSNINLKIITYDTIDRDNIIQEFNYGETIKLSRYANFIEIIEDSKDKIEFSYAKIDSILLTEIDYCKNNPCTQENRERCINLENNYNCICNKDYYDDNGVCKLKTPCSPTPCMEENRTICTIDNNDYICSCNHGYILDNNHCEKISCSYNPCEKNQDCIDTDNSYKCSCKKGYSDKNGVCIKVKSDSCSYSSSNINHISLLFFLFFILILKKISKINL